MQVLPMPELSLRFAPRLDGKAIGFVECATECNTNLV